MIPLFCCPKKTFQAESSEDRSESSKDRSESSKDTSDTQALLTNSTRNDYQSMGTHLIMLICTDNDLLL